MRTMILVIFALFMADGFAAEGTFEIPVNYNDFKPRDQQLIDHSELRIKYVGLSGHHCGVIYKIISGWSHGSTYKRACYWHNSSSLRTCGDDNSQYALNCHQLAIQHFRVQRLLQPNQPPRQYPRPAPIPRSGPYNLPVPPPYTS